MATIRFKGNTTNENPPASLESREIAINEVTGKIYAKRKGNDSESDRIFCIAGNDGKVIYSDNSPSENTDTYLLLSADEPIEIRKITFRLEEGVLLNCSLKKKIHDQPPTEGSGLQTIATFDVNETLQSKDIAEIPSTNETLTPWTPSALTNLVGHWDADAITGQSDNTALSTWSDLSASGWNATSSSTDRPTYRTGVLNGKGIVRFGGSNHLSLGSVNLFRNVGGGTIYAVTKNSSLGVLRTIFAGSTPNSTFRLGLRNTADNLFNVGGRRLDADTFRNVSSTQSVTTNWTLHGCVSDWTARRLSQFINGVRDGLDISWHTGGNTSDTASSSTATCIGAFNTSNANGFNGDIAEIVVTHSAINTLLERQKLEGYLAHKWGLTGNLPTGHLFKNTSPTVEDTIDVNSENRILNVGDGLLLRTGIGDDSPAKFTLQINFRVLS